MAVAVRLLLQAREQATRDLRHGVDTAGAREVVGTSARSPVNGDKVISQAVSRHLDVVDVPDKWRTTTPVEAAELLIASNPAMLTHRQKGKRAATQVGEQTLRQIRWAPCCFRSR